MLNGWTCGQDYLLAGGVRTIGVGGDLEPRHDGIPRQIGVMNDETASGGVIRIEGEAEQALLPAVRDLGAEIEEWQREGASRP